MTMILTLWAIALRFLMPTLTSLGPYWGAITAVGVVWLGINIIMPDAKT